MTFEYDSETSKYTCEQCNSQDVTKEVEKHHGDIEREIFNDQGEVIEYKMIAVDGTRLTCNNCKIVEIFG
jgi:hypothetical protein